MHGAGSLFVDRAVDQGGVVMVLLLRGGASLMGEVGLSMSIPMSKVLGARLVLVRETDMNQTQPNTGKTVWKVWSLVWSA